MQKTILITGSTDGIGLETAKTLLSKGHQVLVHGRSPTKLEKAKKILSSLADETRVQSYLADLSCMTDVAALANAIKEKHDKLDVLINNAGVYKTHEPNISEGLDVRFAVNTIAPILLTQKLLPLLGSDARVINLSSAAQAPVQLEALAGKVKLFNDLNAYAQSKLALTMWSHTMALSLKENAPVFIAVNPGSLLATKLVKEGFGIDGKDIHIGSDILTRLALEDEYASSSGQYFDNDLGQFCAPHPDTLDPEKCEQILQVIETVLDDMKQ